MASRNDLAGIEEQILECERKRIVALVSDDMDLLASLLADDLVHVHATSMVHGKQDVLHHAGKFLRFVDVQRGPLLVRPLAADVAIMTGPMTNTLKRRDAEELVPVEAYVTQVWVRREGSWLLASFHAVRIQDQPSGAQTVPAMPRN